MGFSLPVRAALTIAFLLTVAVAMTGILSLYQLRSFSNEFLRDRMVLVLDGIRDSMEASLSIGLPLDALPGVDRDIHDSMERDPQILSIEFFDPAGSIQYSSDETLLGDLVSEEWATDWDVGENPFWTREERDAKVVGLRVRDALGLDIGSLALRYSREAFEEPIADMALRIGIVSVVVVLILGGIGAWLSYRLMGGISSILVVTRQLVDGSGADSERSNERVFDVPRQFADTALRVMESLHQAKTDIREIEEGAEVRIVSEDPGR